MNLFQKHKKSACVNRSQSVRDEKMRRAAYTLEKTVGNQNPMSRGQGYSGESKAAMLQMMQDND